MLLSAVLDLLFLECRTASLTLLGGTLAALLALGKILEASFLLLVDQVHLGGHASDFPKLDLLDVRVV